jgi:phenylalanyl-tRNA synthetase beta chain
LGEVVVPDPQAETGTRSEVHLGVLLAHANANFSEAHSFLDLLCFYLGWAYALTPTDHQSFLEGRVGRVERDGNAAGLIGELHPEVLERWQITMPCSAFELVIDLPGKPQS